MASSQMLRPQNRSLFTQNDNNFSLNELTQINMCKAKSNYIYSRLNVKIQLRRSNERALNVGATKLFKPVKSLKTFARKLNISSFNLNQSVER